MSPPAPHARRGAHRAGRDIVAALVPSLLAVLAVSALVTALLVWRGQDPQAPVAAGNHATASSTASASVSPSATRSTSHPATTTPRATTPATATSTAPAATTAAGRLQVVVLNQTRRAGLAGKAADRLRAKGWVVRTGNFSGNVPATTVYYPPGQQQEAAQVAAALPTSPRVRVRFGNLSTTRLTVIVTDSYPG
jgi:hypothetical protein